MFWVLQCNMMAEGAFNSLIEQLDRQDVPYCIVQKIPFSLEVAPDPTPLIEASGEKAVFVVGATGMSKVAKDRGWVYLDGNINYEALIKQYGDLMLNADSMIAKFGHIDEQHVQLGKQLFGDPVFIRPVLDSKSFSGQVMSWHDLVEWRKRVIENNEVSSFSTLTAFDEVVISGLKEIYAEYRFLVVNGQVITGSLYKRGNMIYSEACNEGDVLDFAQRMAGIWCPNEAFCLDIAETPDGLKVLEINTVNSAGFYAMDMSRYVNALNTMYG